GAAAKAVEFGLRAGRQALAMLAYEDAVAHYERALAALALEPPDDRRRMEVLLVVGDAAWRGGRNPRAREASAQAVHSARALGDRHAHVRAALRFAHASLVWFRHDPAVVELLDEALGLIPEHDDGPRAHVLAALASALYFSSDFARCDAASQEAVEAAPRGAISLVRLRAWRCREPGGRRSRSPRRCSGGARHRAAGTPAGLARARRYRRPPRAGERDRCTRRSDREAPRRAREPAVAGALPPRARRHRRRGTGGGADAPRRRAEPPSRTALARHRASRLPRDLRRPTRRGRGARDRGPRHPARRGRPRSRARVHRAALPLPA